jgi:hypothetical protein
VLDDQQPFNAANTPAFKHMMSTATGDVYHGCCDNTVHNHITGIAMEGRSEAKGFVGELQQAKVKPNISGDLWSKNGTALFGIILHGITRSANPDGSVKWTMEEKLGAALPCSQERHTGSHIAEMTDDAMAAVGVDIPEEELFKRICDNGSNMIKGWEDGDTVPCADHTLELSVNLYVEHPPIAATISQGKGTVGYFNSSTIGSSDLKKEQHEVNIPEVNAPPPPTPHAP